MRWHLGHFLLCKQRPTIFVSAYARRVHVYCVKNVWELLSVYALVPIGGNVTIWRKHTVSIAQSAGH